MNLRKSCIRKNVQNFHIPAESALSEAHFPHSIIANKIFTNDLAFSRQYIMENAA